MPVMLCKSAQLSVPRLAWQDDEQGGHGRLSSKTMLLLHAVVQRWVITGPQPDDHDAHTASVMQSYFLAPLRCRQGVVGLLILGHSKPQYFEHHSWEATGEVAAAWLSRFFLDGQLTNYCSTLHRISTCASLNDLVKVVSWTVMQQQLQALHQAPLQCRVALLRQDALCALLFDDLWHPLPDVEPAVPKKASLHHDNMRSSTHSQGLHGGAGQSSSICKLTSRLSTGTQRNSGSQMLSSRLSTSHRIMGLVHKPHARDQQHQPTHTTSAVTELCHATALYGSVTGPLGPPPFLTSVPATAAIDMMAPCLPPCREWGLQHPCPGLAWHSTASQTQPSQPCQGPAGHALPPLPPIHGSLSTALQPGLVSEAHGTYVPLTKTVLGEAVRWRSAVWISDCPAFMQNARNPNQDVYLASSQEAAGCMVVCPVYHQDKPFMALYLNMAQRYSTEVLQAVGQALNEICGVLQPAIWHLLHSELDAEWQYLQTQVLGGPDSSSEALQAGDRILLSAFASIAHSSTAPCLPRPPSVAKDSPRLGWAVEGQGQLAARAWGQDHEANSTEAAVQSSAAAMQFQQAVDQAHLPTSVLMQCIEEEMPSLVSIHGNQPLPLRSTCTQPAPVILLANSTSAAPSPASGLCTRPAAESAGFITGQAPDAPTLHQASSPPSHIHEVPPKQLLASPLAQLVPENLGLNTVPCNPLHGTSLDGPTLTSSDSGSFSGSPCIRARGLDRTDSAPDQQPATCSQPALVAAGSLPDPLWPLPGHLPMHKSYSSELQQMLHTVLGKLPTATQPGEAGRLRKGLHGRGPWLNRDLKGTLLGLFKRESRSFNGRGQAVQVAQSVTHDTHEEPAVQRAASCTTHSSSASKANKQRLPSRWSLDPDRQAEAATPCVSSCAELTSRNTDTGSLETQGVGVADPPPFPASHLHGKPPLSSVDLSARPLLPGTVPHSPQDGSRKSNPALQRLLMSLPDLPSSTTHQWQAEVVPDSMQVKLAGSSSLKSVRRKTSFQVSRSPIASSSARRIGALISGLQDKVQEAQRYQLQARASFVRHEELSSISISAKIGAGGFGACYRALYQGAEVAIKVVHDRHGSATEVFRNAVELAVLSTLSHVLTYFTDVGVSYPSIDEVLNGTSAPIHLHSAEELGALEATVQQQQQHQAAGPQQQTLQDQQQQLTQDRLLVLYPEPTSQPLTTHTQKMRRALLICMEYCDMGTLADAMLRGTFHDNTSGSQPALPRWAAIYQTLLELALALRYLHSLSLVHRDVKLQNVLLKSNSNDPRGFICKLSDFGLVKLMSEKQSCLSSSSNVQLDTLLPAEPSPVESAELNLNFRPWSEVFASPRPEPGPQPVRKAPEVPCASRRARKAPAGSVFGIPVAPRRYSGTVTHLPPEAFGSGHGQVDPSIDIWAFGICMWELATGRTVYGELMSEAIILRAANPSMRPVFHGCVPQEYSQLAARRHLLHLPLAPVATHTPLAAASSSATLRVVCEEEGEGEAEGGAAGLSRQELEDAASDSSASVVSGLSLYTTHTHAATGSPEEEASLVSHLLGLAPSVVQLQEAGGLAELLITLGHESDARTLQAAVTAWQAAHKAALEELKAHPLDMQLVPLPLRDSLTQLQQQAAAAAATTVAWKWDMLRQA
ncbi:hypothetical protein QJQ45_000520 [Haematococcus lacustris]|nr:hypothetical protein QJQ45_000520 [Haematococcus lacustris]